MELNRRKLAVGLTVFGALVLVYLAYIRFGGAGRIDLRPSDQLGDEMLTGSASLYDANAARIAGTEVGAIRQTVFIHKTNGVVDREFGFDTLLPQKGDQWEVTKPYMRLFMSGFRCHVTADVGEVQCEDSPGGRPIPNDATFTGNVVIHVMQNDPNGANGPMELFIYLDDVAFVAEQSLFSTAGSVKFVSRVAQLVGRGMELIYDEGRNRLELFRIRDLESLRGRSADLTLLTEKTRQDQSLAPDANQPAEPNDPNAVVLTADHATAPDETPDSYECVFWKNVRIETPQQIIVARQRLAVNNIIFSGRKTPPPAQAKPAIVSTTGVSVADPNEPNEPEIVPYPGPNALDTKPSQFLALDTLPESSFDIIVTCDGGFVVGPTGIAASTIDPNVAAGAVERDSPALTGPLPVDPNHQTLHAEWIDVNAVTSNLELAGPVQIGFALDPNLLAGRAPSGRLMPVTVTAQDVVRYLHATNQIRFEGDCVATVIQMTEKPDVPPLRDEYALRAPILTLDLAQDPNAARDKVQVRHVAAFGGPISLQGLRQAGAETVGWAKLDASSLDCNVPDEAFLVTGPGTISVYYAAALDPDADPNAVSFYALMSDFQRLTYATAAQRIVAESDERIQLGYLPILEDGSYGPARNADAGHIEIMLTRTADNQVELTGLTASRGITYEDDTQRFAGSVLTYAAATNLVHVTGDAAQPCYLNGVLVDQIEMNVTTGDVKMKSEGPGTLMVK